MLFTVAANHLLSCFAADAVIVKMGYDVQKLNYKKLLSSDLSEGLRTDPALMALLTKIRIMKRLLS